MIIFSEQPGVKSDPGVMEPVKKESPTNSDDPCRDAGDIGENLRISHSDSNDDDVTSTSQPKISDDSIGADEMTSPRLGMKEGGDVRDRHRKSPFSDTRSPPNVTVISPSAHQHHQSLLPYLYYSAMYNAVQAHAHSSYPMPFAVPAGGGLPSLPGGMALPGFPTSALKMPTHAMVTSGNNGLASGALSSAFNAHSNNNNNKHYRPDRISSPTDTNSNMLLNTSLAMAASGQRHLWQPYLKSTSAMCRDGKLNSSHCHKPDSGVTGGLYREDRPHSCSPNRDTVSPPGEYYDRSTSPIERLENRGSDERHHSRKRERSRSPSPIRHIFKHPRLGAQSHLSSAFHKHHAPDHHTDNQLRNIEKMVDGLHARRCRETVTLVMPSS